jgi:hypothetical protein
MSSFFTPKGELTSDTNKRKPKAMEVDIESNKRPKVAVDVLGSPVLSTLFGTGVSVSHVARAPRSSAKVFDAPKKKREIPAQKAVPIHITHK